MENNQINNNQIYFNLKHPSNNNQSLEKEDVVNFFEKNRENAIILAVFNVYSKLLSSNVDNIDISEQDVADVTKLAENIFEDFKLSDNYQQIAACNDQLINHLKSEDSQIKNDAKFALKTYITYLVKCAKIKEEASKDQSKSTLLEDNFNKVFSQDLKVCAGGITSAFENALSTGPKARIIEELIKKWVKILNIPDVMETHLRPFLINMFDKKVEDIHKDNIPNYFTRSELHDLISCIASGDFFDYIAQDIKDIYQELNKMPNNTINGYYNLKPAELMTKDHYLFIEKILDSYCFINEDDYQLIKNEEKLLTKLKEKLLEKGLFKKNKDDYETQTKSQQLIELLTSSFKNKDLFFYSQLLSYKILDDNNKIIENNLDDLVNSSKGNDGFKEFVKKRIINITKEILNNNNCKKIIKKIRLLSTNKPNKLLDQIAKKFLSFDKKDISLLIEGNAPYIILEQAIENIKNPQDIEFDINKLANNPEAGVVIRSLKEKGILPKTKINPNFYNLIYNRNYAFLDILLSNYPNYFSVKEYFDFLNQDPNLENNMPLKQKLAFIDWLDDKINNQNISQEVKNNLVNIVKVNKYLLLEISANQPKDFGKYLEIIVKYSQNDQSFLVTLLSKENDYKATSLHYLAEKNQEIFFNIIKFLTTEQGDQPPLIAGEQLFELLSKENSYNATSLSFLAQKNQEIFLKTIKLLATKQEDRPPLITGEQLFELLSKEDDNNITPLHFLAQENPQIFLETIKFLTTQQENKSLLITEDQLFGLLNKKDVMKLNNKLDIKQNWHLLIGLMIKLIIKTYLKKPKII